MLRGIDIDLEVKVKRGWLIGVVQKNRDEHRDTFTKAHQKYQDAIIKWLTEYLEEARTTKRDITVKYFQGAQPEDHTIDYDLVLDMLKNGSEDTINITGSDYRRFVLDRWDWTQQFVSASNAYGVSTKFDGLRDDA